MVWRHLLVAANDSGIRRSSLTKLSAELELPVSTIHKALERPRAIGAVQGSAGGLRVLDPRRLQLMWAASRDLRRDLVYTTRVPMAIREIEARLPTSAIPTAYTAFVQHEGRNVVADYEQVVVYADGNELRRLFPPRPGQANLLVLEPDHLLRRYGKVAPTCQVYADLFNLPTWQAQRFLETLDRQLAGDVVPVEVPIDQTETIDHARVLTAEALFVAKMAALLDRPDTLPGEKDRREMWELISSGSGLDFKTVAGIVQRGGWDGRSQTELLDHTFDLLGETTELSKRDRATLRLNRALAVEAAGALEGRDRDLER